MLVVEESFGVAHSIFVTKYHLSHVTNLEEIMVDCRDGEKPSTPRTGNGKWADADGRADGRTDGWVQYLRKKRAAFCAPPPR